MRKGKFNWCGDLQWGSTGKGLAAAYLAAKYGVTHASTTNLPNAGHTAIVTDANDERTERKFISKVIPTCAIVNKPFLFKTNYNTIHDFNGSDAVVALNDQLKYYIGPGAGFNIDRLMQEVEETGLSPSQLRIHPRAVVVTNQHKNEEIKGASSTKHIASTMQGSASAVVDKMMRGSDVKLAGDYEELEKFTHSVGRVSFQEEVHASINKGATWMHEGSQGFSLGINYGSHYPYCTSRECTVMQSMADMGVPPDMVGDVVGVMRPYPIRVGNVVENGKQVGYSGDCYDDHKEISWDEVHKRAGYPADFKLSELTTVTKRVRRVFEFSLKQIKQAIAINGINKIFLNFANYLDYEIYGTDDPNDITDPIWGFIARLERNTGVRVAWVGTGPSIDHVVEL